MNDDKIRISPDALIAMIVTEAQDRELARMAEFGRDERRLPALRKIPAKNGSPCS